MQLQLNDLTIADFLEQYWQKKPLVIRQGFKNFKDLLSADELAGMAMEPEVESRLIWQQSGVWQAKIGPFENYDTLSSNNWTLVVQALNHWLPAAEGLSHQFDFIPRWRFDDVMASFAVEGGGVGPHIDNYDVFICQGSGRRRWRVGDKGNHRQYSAHEVLLHTEAFKPIIDVELAAGDILYLPPGFPHDGITLEPSMSFSVGYRTATAKDMFSGFADYLMDKDLGNEQITDPERLQSNTSGIINSADFERIKHQLLEQLTDSNIADFSGRLLTQSKCELDLYEDVLDISAQDWQQELQMQPLTRLCGLKLAYFELNYQQGTFYLNGDVESIPSICANVIPLLCDAPSMGYQQIKPYSNNPQFVKTMTRWIQKGYWYFD